MTLTVSGLNFSYGKRQILWDTSFGPLEESKMTALIGPNASGKSTLFRVIAGLLKPAGGFVHLDGMNLATLSDRQRLGQVCFMPQFFAANAALSVFDVVMTSHKSLSGGRVTSQDMEIVGQVLHDSGIGHLSEAYVSELSGGQSQMVSVAQALIRNSQVYLLDEPTSALDMRHQLSVLGQIRKAVRKRRKVGIVALHDLNLAARFADHLLLMRNGKIVAQGAPADVLHLPETGNAYGVDIHIANGRGKDLIVHAYPS